jgi:hypothetical protein
MHGELQAKGMNWLHKLPQFCGPKTPIPAGQQGPHPFILKGHRWTICISELIMNPSDTLSSSNEYTTKIGHRVVILWKIRTGIHRKPKSL